MNHNNTRPYGQTVQDYEYPPPPPTPPRQSVSNIVTLGLSIVAGVMFLSLFFSGFSVAITVISTTVFYGGILTLLVLIDSGTLTSYLTKRVESHTQIELARLDHATQRITVERSRQLPDYGPSVDGPQAALPAPSNFVAPVADPDDSAKREAAAWIAQLYGEDGEPDPKKVLLKSDKERPGRLRIAAPSRPAKEYLLHRSVLLDLGTGFRLNLVRCPTRDTALAQIYVNGVSRSPTHHHLPTTTHALGEVTP